MLARLPITNLDSGYVREAVEEESPERSSASFRERPSRLLTDCQEEMCIYLRVGECVGSVSNECWL